MATALIDALSIRLWHSGASLARALELQALCGDATPAVVGIGTHGVSIGRDDRSDVVIASPDVSRRHAVLALTHDGVRLCDAGSAAGIWLDGRRVYDELIAPGEQFQVGSCVFCVTRAGELLPAPRQHVAPAVARSSTLLDYELLDLTHTGGTFVTRRARRRANCAAHGVDALVAVKFLGHDAPARGERAGLRARFGRYLQHAVRIEHAGCVTVLGGDAVAETPYVVEVFHPGGSLRTRAASLSTLERLRALLEVCEALSWLHARGLAHGCITPGDILFGADNRARLANAGLMAALGWDAMLRQRAVRDGLAGPELTGIAGGEAIQPSADIYALGAIGRIFCVEAGREVARLLDAMAASDPARRPSAAAVAAALGHIIGPTGPAASTVPGRPIRLHVLSTGRIIPVTATPFALGRAQLNPSDRALSREHAALRFSDDAWVIDATRGRDVWIDGAVVDGMRALAIGDVMRLGDTRVRILV